MQFRQLGESGLEVSLVGLGSNNFGPPKGVMQSHRSLLASLEPMRTAFTLGPRDESVLRVVGSSKRASFFAALAPALGPLLTVLEAYGETGPSSTTWNDSMWTSSLAKLWRSG